MESALSLYFSRDIEQQRLDWFLAHPSHPDATFSGQIEFDGRVLSGDPLGFGVQGHNCGYRHRNFWTWTHAYFPRTGQPASTLEALRYEMPFGLVSP